MIVAGDDPKVTSFQRYGRTFHSDRLQPTCRQVVSKADALETEVVLFLDVDIQTVQDGIVIIKRIFLRPVAAVDEPRRCPLWIVGCPTVQDVTVCV